MVRDMSARVLAIAPKLARACSYPYDMYGITSSVPKGRLNLTDSM